MATPTRPLGPGDRAPDFTLRRTFDEDVTLSELTARGPVALVFYVFDFGSV
jgi:peroxiredoxin